MGVGRWEGMASIEPKIGVPLKEGSRNRGFAGMAGIFSLTLLTYSIACFVIAAQELGGSAGAAITWLLIGSACFFVAVKLGRRLTLGLYRAALTIGADEVVVRNPFKTYRVPMNSVDQFDSRLNDIGFGNPTPGIALLRRGEKPIFVWTLASESAIWSNAKHVESWTETSDALNALLDSLGHQRGAALPSQAP